MLHRARKPRIRRPSAFCLFVALGAAGERRRTEWLGGGWIGDALAADNYLFEVT